MPREERANRLVAVTTLATFSTNEVTFFQDDQQRLLDGRDDPEQQQLSERGHRGSQQRARRRLEPETARLTGSAASVEHDR